MRTRPVAAQSGGTAMDTHRILVSRLARRKREIGASVLEGHGQRDMTSLMRLVLPHA